MDGEEIDGVVIRGGGHGLKVVLKLRHQIFFQLCPEMSTATFRAVANPRVAKVP